MEKIKQIFITLRTCKRVQWDKCCNVDIVCDLGVQDGGGTGISVADSCL